jgi:hypothetical protein
MKKGLLAVAALTSAALTTNAALLKINDQTFANFGLKMQIYGQSLEDAANGGKDNAIDFNVQHARVYFSGQLNPIVQFGANLDFALTGSKTSHESTSETKAIAVHFFVSSSNKGKFILIRDHKNYSPIFLLKYVSLFSFIKFFYD